MKTSELRIGNYHYVNFGKPDQAIKAIDAADILFLSENPSDESYGCVPLSEAWDIVANFGFDWRSSFRCEKRVGGYTFLLFKTGGYWSFETRGSMEIVPLREITFIHELQNILSSLGEDAQ